MNKFLLFVFFIGFIAIGFSQEMEKHTNSWWLINTKIKLAKKVDFNNEIHLRRLDGINSWQQIILRPSIVYKSNEQVSLTLGYSFIQNWTYGQQTASFDMNQHNIWQQVVLINKFDKFQITHRFREEERLSSYNYHTESNKYDYKYSNRFRYRLIISFPINEKLKFQLFNEVFLLQANGIIPIAVNQNWSSFGVKYKVNPTLTMSAGYMLQHIYRSNYLEKDNVLTFSVGKYFKKKE